MNIYDACDYIILKMTEGQDSLNNIKLQKLLYYVQAWYLAFNEKPLFEDGENFQAWVHGPVNRQIYDRFSSTKSLYADITYDDIRDGFDFENLNEDELEHIDVVLELYGKYSGTELEDMTHEEEPWINARTGFRSSQRCEVELNNSDMYTYYSSRLVD